MNLFIISLVLIQSCKKGDNNVTPSTTNSTCGMVNISTLNGKESHNIGKNCMNCHKDGGQGKGCFLAAGTVYDKTQTSTRSNGTVKLYTGVNGTGDLRATLYVDGNGNFYTTANIDFTGGLYPTIIGCSGDVHHMPSSISMGQCNSCHGVSTNKIWVN